MAFDISAGQIIRGIAGVLLVLLGAYVATLRPRRRENRAFAAFCMLSGAGFVAALTPENDPSASGAVLVIAGLLFAAAGVALVTVATAFPRPLSDAERGLARTATLVALVLGIIQGVAYVGRNAGDEFVTEAVQTGALVEDLGLTAFRSAAWFGALLAAMRLARASDAPRAERHALLSLTVALALYPATHGPYHVLDDNAWDAVIGGATWLLLLLVVFFLLRAASATASKVGARWAAWSLLAMSALQMAWSALSDLPVSPVSVSIAAMFVVLAHAILQNQLLGIEVKLRFAISKSTIAAVFIAVFFVASEAAQQFLGETLGSTYVGIAAAGGLVFAIVPLQRAAERLAEKAVPIAGPPTSEETLRAARDDADQEAIYRNALRLALRDRRLTRTEEAHLHELAEALRIRPRRAHEMLAEVEREVGADPL